MRRCSLALFVASVGCGSPSGGVKDSAADSALESDFVVCTAEYVPGLIIRVVEARSRTPLGGFTAVLRLDSAGASWPVDSIHSSAGHSEWRTAYERAGTYGLRIKRSGYRTWDTAGIHLTADRCHVNTITLEARLQPQP